jgi:hypothetical protein
MFDIFGPILQPRTLIEERKFDTSRFDKHNGRYVIPMHKNDVWTNKWKQDLRRNFLQSNYHDPGA